MSGRIFVGFQILVLMFATMQITGAAQVFAQAQADPLQKALRYACPMHQEITSTKPASCPKCSMALRLVADKVEAGVTPTANSVVSVTNKPPSISWSRIPAIKVYDQYGNLKNFYTDLVKGKRVVINFIFTTCTTICPPLTATFRRLQQNLAERGLDVELISISVDPTTDTSERLQGFADKFKAGPGWTFVTGEKAEVDSLLQVLGVTVANKNDHTPMILIGNDVTGFWTRANGLSSPEALVKIITDAANRK